MHTDTRPEPSVISPAPPPPGPPARLATRKMRPFGDFVRGYLVGFLGGGALLFGLIVAALLMFPPPRTNILFLGLDRRPDEKTFVSRTDTMILATIYPEQTYAGLLSIPRDLYVRLPGGAEGRINTAHFLAEAETPGAGPAAAMETVRANFGVAVHNYVRMDLAGFVKIVDAVGGIEVDVPHPLIDYEYPTDDYGVTTVAFEAGRQHMDGARALAYARIRHGSSDFQRAERQQLVIQALAARLLQPGAWAYLPRLIAAVKQSASTDLTFLQAVRLAPTLLLVGPSGLDHRVIEGEMVQPYTTDGGGAVQLPVWAKINPVLMEMFGQ
ncbi:MAG TPA: LCP family protein [Anaerolineales bacterium]|nr:LCP family protein [Anaerolineales bacterium]